MKTKKLSTISYVYLICMFGLLGQIKHLQAADKPPPSDTLKSSSVENLSNAGLKYEDLDKIDATSNDHGSQFWVEKRGRFIIGLAVSLVIILAAIKKLYTIYTNFRTLSPDSPASSES